MKRYQESNRQMQISVGLWACLIGFVCGLVVVDSAPAQRRQGNTGPNRQTTRQQEGKVYGRDREDQSTVIDRDPYIEIHLNKDNQYAILHVKPVLKNDAGDEMKPPYNLGQKGYCVFLFVNDSSQQYEVPWSSIVKIVTFDELVLAEAESAMRQGNLDTAFKGYLFLYDRNRVNLAVRKALENYLFIDGQKLMKEGRYSEALTVLEELYDRRPTFVFPGQPDGLVGAISNCYDKVIEKKADDNDLPAVRKILTFIENNYGERMEKISTKWRSEIVNIGKAVLEDAKLAVAGDDPYEAHEKVRVMMHAIPEIAESRQLFEEVITKFPYVYVGVAQQPGNFDSSDITHFANRRAGRLTHRNMIEFIEPGDEGGKYIFPSGQLTPVGESGMTYKFVINALPGSPSRLGVPPVSAYEVSSRLLQLGDLESAQLHVPWARIVRSIEIENENSVLVNLRYPHVRPESLLQVPYAFQPKGAPTENGYYTTVESDENRTLFKLNPLYPRVAGRQHPQIVERKFKSRAAAVQALIRGEVDAVDRVFPLDIRKLKKDPLIEVKPYNLPSVHMLIPNQRNDYMKSRDFRIALLYGLNRELILSQMITGGQEIPGFELVSGPFPIGSPDADQTAYGYNFNVRPTLYNIYLGITMAQFAKVQLLKQMTKRAEKIFRPDFDLLTKEDPKQALLKKLEEIVSEVGNDEDELLTQLFPEFSKTFPESDEEGLEERLKEFVKDLPMIKQPEITLAYPADDLSELCCEAIRQMWAVLGVKVRMRRLPPGVTVPDDDNYDFLYAEVTMHEPLLDVGDLIGERGLAKTVSASINLELQRLARADRWQTVFTSLKAIHRHCNAEMAVLPLWQITEHYAYRKNLKNTGTRISNLYQHVDRWKLDPPAKPDE